MIVPVQTASFFLPLVIPLPRQLLSQFPEVSEPIIVDASKPDNYTGRTNESASSARQRIAEYFEPGTYPSIYGAVDMGSFPGM